MLCHNVVISFECMSAERKARQSQTGFLKIQFNMCVCARVQSLTPVKGPSHVLSVFTENLDKTVPPCQT